MSPRVPAPSAPSPGGPPPDRAAPPEPEGRRRRSPIPRLTLRIYLVALTPILAIAGVALVISTLRPLPTPPRWEIEQAHRAAEALSGATRDILVMQRALADIHAQVTVYAGDGRMLASNVDPPLPPLRDEDLAGLASQRELIGPGIPSTIGVPLVPGAEAGAYVQVRMLPPNNRVDDGPRDPRRRRHGPPSDPVVWTVLVGLLATAVAAVVLARSLTRPLSGLAAAARAFGAGDLSARAKLARKDELGELGRAFDEMAERVSGLMRSQQELLANVSHELRTPLARIRVALDIAAEGDAASAREALSEITEDLAELEQIVSEVLTTARLDLAAGRAGPGLRVAGDVLDLAALADKAAARFQTHAPSRALELHLDALGEHGTPGTARVRGDAVLLRRALDNLLDNARAYSDPATTVTLEAARDGDVVHLRVVDHGIGIVPEDLPRLATPFFRTDRSRSRKSGGLGLGLSLTRRIVEAHGGTLTIDSVVGKGTTVTITLPLARDAGEA